jgi:hypothetical protein
LVPVTCKRIVNAPRGASKAGLGGIGIEALTFSRADAGHPVLAAPHLGQSQGIVRGAQEGSYEGNRIGGPVGGAGAMGAVKGVFGIPDRGWHRGHRAAAITTVTAPSGGQFLSRYPVLKIHQMIAMQVTRKATVMPMLKETLTSAIS